MSEEIMRGCEFERAGTTYHVRIGTTNIEHYTGGDWVEITGTNLSGDTDNLVDIAFPLLSGARILCVTNGIDNVRKWTGSGNTADLGGSPPVAKFIQEYKTYLVCGNIQGGTDIGERVQWCDTANPENWSTGNSGSRDLIDDNENITGISLFGDYIAVHKKTSIYLGYLVNTSDIFKFDRKATGSGTVANQSIVNLPTGHQAFVASDGIRIFNGIVATLVDAKVNGEIRASINADRWHKCWGILVKEKDEAWFGIPIGSQTTPDTVYKYNYKTGVIYKDIRSGQTAAWRAAASSTSKTWGSTSGTWGASTEKWSDSQIGADFTSIYFGSNGGVVSKYDSDVNNDNASAIESFWESKDFESQEKGRIARWKRLEFWAKGNTVDIYYSTDEGETWTQMLDAPFTLGSSFPDDTSPDVAYFDAIGSRIRIRFENKVDGETFQLKQFILGYTDRELRR
jgi:hypothetical protein